MPFPADRYDSRFWVCLGSVLGFTVVSYWLLTDYADVPWFAGEDGLSQWWSVASYVASAGMAGISSRCLSMGGHPHLAIFYALMAALLLVGALEAMSWGQRTFGWSTPDSLGRINEQNETTLHNFRRFNEGLYAVFLVVGCAGLVGWGVRALLHRRRRVTTADFLLPSLVMAPALVMVAIWVAAGEDYAGNPFRAMLVRLDSVPIGSEVAEGLMGLCLVLYTGANFRRALRLPSRESRRSVATQATGTPRGTST